MDFEEILTYFDVVRKGQGKAQAKCPCHDDKQASLTISKGEKQPVVFHCHAGCATEAILGAVGLTMQNIMDDSKRPPKQPVEAWKAYVEDREKKKVVARYDYQDPEGNYVFSRLRLEPKDFLYGVFFGDRFTYGLGGRNRKDIPAVFCPNYEGFRAAAAARETVFYCEGEKDVLTMQARGFHALTCGGATDWNTDVSEVFRGAVVVVLADNDEPGQKLAAQVRNDLKKVARFVRIVTPSQEEHGDVSDFFQDHTAGDFKQLLLQYFHTWDEKRQLQGVYDYRVFEFLKAREDILILGGTPFIYQGGVFREDSNGAILKTMIRNLIYPSKVKSNTLKRIYDLFISAAEIQARAEDFNQFPETWINFRNGFYDSVNGKMVPHDPKYRALNQIPHDFHPGKAESGKIVPEWLDFITEGKPDNLEMLMQFAGYCLTMDTRQQKFLILCGLGGTGKSLLIRLIEEMIGTENTAHISLVDLTQRFASYGLLGKLLNSCADLEITALEDASTLKKILGEDGIRAEAKGKDAISFKSRAKLVFSTNELPLVKGERTNGFYRRLLVLPMNRTPDAKRPDFYEDLKAELPWFIQEAVKALGRMHKAGYITESKDSKAAVKQLRQDSDTVEAFINAKLYRGKEYRAERAKLFTEYEAYCRDMERQPLTKANFFKALRTKGLFETKYNGTICIRGISFDDFAPKSAAKMPQNDFEGVPEGFDLPFL